MSQNTSGAGVLVLAWQGGQLRAHSPLPGYSPWAIPGSWRRMAMVVPTHPAFAFWGQSNCGPVPLADVHPPAGHLARFCHP